MRSVAIALALILSDCALAPNTVTPQLTHESHILQHEPFTSTPTNYFANIAEIEARWKLPHHFVLSVADGVNLARSYPNDPSYGEIMGRTRETFRASIGYSFEVKK
jgi:hypothetical protein